MNIKTQYGAGLRTGMLIGASSVALLLLLIVGFASASDWGVSVFGGGISADKLGGVGSMKSSAGVGVDFTGRDVSASAAIWRITEKLDDDAGISPVHGGTIEASRRFMGSWRVGALYAWTDVDRFVHATIGLANRNASIDWLVPINDSRFGLRARLRAPISGCWFAQAQYEYLGRQDPDIKISSIGLGIGRPLTRCR